MSSKIMPAGEGDGQIVETLKWLKENGWSGPLTIEPHLKAAGPYGGFSGPELFKVAADALKNVLNKAGVAL
jgi:sugar phosphate isomerase/epimerase